MSAGRLADWAVKSAIAIGSGVCAGKILEKWRSPKIVEEGKTIDETERGVVVQTTVQVYCGTETPPSVVERQHDQAAVKVSKMDKATGKPDP